MSQLLSRILKPQKRHPSSSLGLKLSWDITMEFLISAPKFALYFPHKEAHYDPINSLTGLIHFLSLLTEI
ncbi:unnamed protein product, partial [Thlaspi arvense]